jgi:hypothetical protein
MKRIIRFAVLAFAATSLYASDNCGVSTLKGSYSFNAQGFTVAGSPVPAPLQGPFASGGIATYDGRGNVTLAATASFNGLSQTLPPVKGTYQVNKDCTFTSKLENGATFFAAIVGNAAELYVLQTNPGVIASGIAVNRSGRDRGDNDSRWWSCQAAITRGAYGFISTGYAGPPTVPPPAAGALAGVGTVDFDPRGTFRLTAVRSANGIIDPQTLTLNGTYTMGPDCTFKMTFDVGFHFTAVITNGASEIEFIETDPGTTFVVHARKI